MNTTTSCKSGHLLAAHFAWLKVHLDAFPRTVRAGVCAVGDARKRFGAVGSVRIGAGFALGGTFVLKAFYGRIFAYAYGNAQDGHDE